MDIGDINKVASRKRINVEAENLRDKVSREKAKIIKLKVAQDTAYWDLKEKLTQLEGNHERLQQNMVDVQMQYETISGQYQDELRLRPETLNKLSSTREICDVLEEYSERLKDTLSRCKTDQETLCEAYRKSGQFVKDMMTKQQQTDEKTQARIRSLEEKSQASGMPQTPPGEKDLQNQITPVNVVQNENKQDSCSAEKDLENPNIPLMGINIQVTETETSCTDINPKTEIAETSSPPGPNLQNPTIPLMDINVQVQSSEKDTSCINPLTETAETISPTGVNPQNPTFPLMDINVQVQSTEKDTSRINPMTETTETISPPGVNLQNPTFPLIEDDIQVQSSKTCLINPMIETTETSSPPGILLQNPTFPLMDINIQEKSMETSRTDINPVTETTESSSLPGTDLQNPAFTLVNISIEKKSTQIYINPMTETTETSSPLGVHLQNPTFASMDINIQKKSIETETSGTEINPMPEKTETSFPAGINLHTPTFPLKINPVTSSSVEVNFHDKENPIIDSNLQGQLSISTQTASMEINPIKKAKSSSSPIDLQTPTFPADYLQDRTTQAQFEIETSDVKDDPQTVNQNFPATQNDPPVNLSKYSLANLSSRYHEELMAYFNAAKQQSDEELRELKSKLATTQRQKDELVKMTYDMTRDMDAMKRELESREKNVISIQNDTKNLMNEFNNKCADFKNTICTLEKDLKSSNEANEALKQALLHQEEYTSAVRQENSVLQEKLAAAEEAVARGTEDLEQMRQKLESTTVTCNTLRRDVAALMEAKEAMEKEIREKNLVLSDLEAATQMAKGEVAKIEIEKVRIMEELNKAQGDVTYRSIVIEQLTASVADCESKIGGLEDTLKQLRLTSEEKIKELTSSIEAKQAESLSKGETIAKLMNDIKMDMEVRNRLEVNLTNSKKELESEKERACEREKKMAARVAHLENVVKDKEQELTKQMSIILGNRCEKEKLQEKISTMQNTIDNIQKELTGRPAPDPRDSRDPPELDDNAVNLSPGPSFPPPAPMSKHKASKLPSQALTSQKLPAQKLPSQKLPSQRRKEERDDNSPVFTLYSDSSMDGDAVDPLEVNRRFEAMQRGVPISSLPLATLKRRRAAAPAPRPPPAAAAAAYSPQSPILSQMRNEMQKEKTFFKTKRHSEHKQKRAKQIDYSENN